MSVRRAGSRSELICAIIASEFVNTGRRETSSFQALVVGKICIAETIASASGVLNRMELVTTGGEPRMRPSWLMRSANARAEIKTKPTRKNVFSTIESSVDSQQKQSHEPRFKFEVLNGRAAELSRVELSGRQECSLTAQNL